jgi:hypothetical protein
MRYATGLPSSVKKFLGIAALVVLSLSVLPIRANAQTGGWPTFTLFVKVGTTRPAALAGSCDAEGVVKQ